MHSLWQNGEPHKQIDTLPGYLTPSHGFLSTRYLGTNRSEFGEGIQFVRYQSHKIFYRIKGDIIEILAIPHIHRNITKQIILRSDTSEM